MKSIEKANILVVDDNPVNRKVLASVLEGLNQNLIIAESGQEALRLVLMHEYAVILMDVQMAGMDGYETATLIRSRKQSESTPIIFVTAYAQEETDILRGYSQGAVDYVFTPIIPEILRAKVLTFVELYQKTQEIKHHEQQLENLVDQRTAALMQEISERKKIQQSLREADRRKDEFLAILAHELRNPLAPIRNSLEIMKQAPTNAELTEQARNMMDRQVAHMERLVEDLLDISRISRNQLELRKQSVDLVSSMHDVLEACSALARQFNHEITVSLPDEPVILDGDVVRLNQIFSNLLTNACKYTPPNGRIFLDVKLRGKLVVVSVKDNGIGIPSEMLPKVFTMFAQGTQELVRAQDGLGIGLTLVKQLVEMHGGWVEAFSEGLGKGSEFVIRLPVSQTHTDTKPLVAVAVKRAPVSRRVLVVDDQEDNANSLSSLLRVAGHNAKVAYDGNAAIAEAKEFRPELILLDIGMPDMNGFEACRCIREEAWGKDLKIMALTGWGQEEDHEKSMAAGFDGHLVKPVSLTALTEILASLPALSRDNISKASAEN